MKGQLSWAHKRKGGKRRQLTREEMSCFEPIKAPSEVKVFTAAERKALESEMASAWSSAQQVLLSYGQDPDDMLRRAAKVCASWRPGK